MLEELQSKIETSHTQLTRLSNDIERMRSIEDALVETDQSIAASANDLKSFVDVASRTHQSLIDASDAFKDAANTLETIDVAKLSETIEAGNDQIRAEILRTETKSQDNLEIAAKRITAVVTDKSKEVLTEFGMYQGNARQDLKAAEKRLTDSAVASGEAALERIDRGTVEVNEATRKAVTPLKWFGGATVLISLAVLVIAVWILVGV